MVSFNIYAIPRDAGGRLRFENAQKVELLEEAERFGLRRVANEYGLAVSQLRFWRGAFRAGKLKRAEFVPVCLAQEPVR